MLQTFLKSIGLVKEFIWVNSFIGVFWEILRLASQQLPCKALLIFAIFSIILSICCCHLVVYYLTKPLWNCVSQVTIAALNVAACFYYCQYDSICREFWSADSTLPYFSEQSENSVSLFEVLFYNRSKLSI